jgi:predicted amidohydrolase
MAITAIPPATCSPNGGFVEDNLKALRRTCRPDWRRGFACGLRGLQPGSSLQDYFNAARLIHRGKIVARRFKTLLPTYDVFDEAEYFQPGHRTRRRALRAQARTHHLRRRVD